MGGFPGGIGDSTTSTTELENVSFPKRCLHVSFFVSVPSRSRNKGKHLARSSSRTAHRWGAFQEESAIRRHPLQKFKTSLSPYSACPSSSLLYFALPHSSRADETCLIQDLGIIWIVPPPVHGQSGHADGARGFVRAVPVPPNLGLNEECPTTSRASTVTLGICPYISAIPPRSV